MKRVGNAFARLTRLAVIGGLALAAPAAWSHGDHRHEATPAQASGGVRVNLGDIALLDQHGRRVRVKSEVFGDRLVVINFVFTTCTTVCPVSTATLVQLQDRLGARLGTDVALVSLSVDPVRDTPPRLREYAGKHGVKPGWTWLTGRKGDVDTVSKAFGAYAPNADDHPALVMVGDPRTQSWTRFFGFPSADELLRQLDDLAAARSRPAAGRHTGHTANSH